jgi:lipopolysaccharide cholinephosphotransferase
MAVIEELDVERLSWIEKLSNRCDKMILGIPDSLPYARIYGNVEYNPEECREYMLSTGWFSDVLILDNCHLRYPAIIDEIKPNVIFINGEYGQEYIDDCEYAGMKGVKLISILEDSGADSPLSIIFALKDVQRHQKIVLYGTGKGVDIYFEHFPKYKPAYIIDEDNNKCGTCINGIEVKSRDVLKGENPEDVTVIICDRNYENIRNWLLEQGFKRYRGLWYRHEVAYLEEFGVAALKEERYLEKNHKLLVKLMEEFDKVCIENSLRYYVICGSLIGTVRHKGMIPWDDDLDIAIPRKDYNKLRRIARKVWGNDNDEFRFLDYDELGGGAFLDCIPRLYYLKDYIPTKCFDKVYGKATADIENRAFVDIYILDNAHPNDKVHSFVTNVAMKGVYNLMMGHRAYVDYDDYRMKCSEKVINIMKFVHSVGGILPLKFLKFWFEFFARSANWNPRSTQYINKCCAVTCLQRRYDKVDYGAGVRMPFESIEVMAPSNYDGQLKGMCYYNYMTFPPYAIRKPSHYFNSDIEIY